MVDWKSFEERGARWANILAALPAFYCGYCLWASRHGEPMSSYPGFVVALGGFVLLIAVGALLNYLRHPTSAPTPLESKTLVPNEASIKEIQSSLEQVLSPLQIEAIELSGFLARFMERLGKRPETPLGADWDGIFDHAVRGEGGAWTIKMQAAFKQECSPLINTFINHLERETGHFNPRLRNYKDHVHDFNNINTVRAQLWLEVLRPLDIDFQGEI